jgi:large repetitive protein
MNTNGRLPGLRLIPSFTWVCAGALVLACLMAAGCAGDPAGTILLPAQQTLPDRDPPAVAVEVFVHNDARYLARVQVDCYIGNTLVHHSEAVLRSSYDSQLEGSLWLDLEEADRVVITCRIDGKGGTALWTDQQTFLMGADFADLDTVMYVIDYNTPPVAVIAAPASQPSGAAVTLDGSGSYDPDGDPITYAWTQLAGPPVALSSTTSSIVTFTAPTVGGPIIGTDGPVAALAAAPVTLTFQLIVNDDFVDSVPATVNIDVTPVIPPLQARPDAPFAVAADSLVTLTSGGSTGPITSWYWTQLPGGPPVFLSPSPDQPIVTFIAPSTGGMLTFELTVSDGTNSDTAPLNVYVIPLDAPGLTPVAVAVTSSPAIASDAVTLYGSGSFDPEGLPLYYLWRQTAGPAVTLSATTDPDVTFIAPYVLAGTSVAFELLVIDDDDLAAVANVALLIEPSTYVGNHPPHLTAATDAAEVYDTWQVHLTASATDSDGDTPTVIWYQDQNFGIDVTKTWTTISSSGPGYATVDHAFIAPAGPLPQDRVLAFIVTATDGQGGVSQVPVTVVVRLLGDVNNDGLVTVPDETLLQNALGSRPGDANWNPWADLDRSGVVDSVDLQILATRIDK